MAFSLATAKPIASTAGSFDLRSARPADQQVPAPAPASLLDRAQALPTGFNAGVAGLLGLPVDTAANVLDLGKAALGYAQSKVTGEAPSAAFDPYERRDIVGSSKWIKGQMNRPFGVTTHASRLAHRRSGA